jgi:hypothetical protein
MPEYEPISLAAFCNAGPEMLGPEARPPVGLQMFQGLPFQIGPAEGEEGPCFLGFGPGIRTEPLTVPIGAPARWVIIAHALRESQIGQGGAVGQVIAQYVFRLANGEEIRVPIRDRFEIAVAPPGWGQAPFLAVPDQKNSLMPRYEGRWESAGLRQTEALQGWPRAYYLWAWENPRPDQALESLKILPEGPTFLIAALTLSHLEEEPFCRAVKREVKIILPRPEDAAQPFNLEVEVDRGVATYPYPLPEKTAEEYLNDDFKGWGEAQNLKSSPAYVEIAANPSATITVKQGEEPLGQARWGELEEKGTVEPTPRLRLEVIDRGKNWVHTTVVDDETGQPIPCRIHFRSPEGVPYQPHGHHNHVHSNLGTWHIDVGGDLRLGQITYAYIDGTCQGWLPRGEVLVDVARGYEYEPLRDRVTIQPGQRELILRLRRWCHLNEERWFSGDTHVHFLSTQGAHLEAQGEDLNVVNLLQSQWGHLFTNTEEFVGRPSVSSDGRSIVYASQENRQHILGHMTLLGLKRPVMPWCSDGPSEAELGGYPETTLAHWADACHAQGGTVILPHFPTPNCEPAVLIATGRVDGLEMTAHGSYPHLEYYRYLNCGYRLPLVGGTDKMTSDVPVGIYRTYVYIPPDEEFTYDNWCRNLRAGRTFQSGGPILRFTVNGRQIGDTISLPGNGGTVEVEAVAESIFPIHTLEIVQQGRVVASTEEARGALRLHLKASLRIDRHTWLAARCGGPGYTSIPHHDGWRRGIMAHTSPIYVAVGGEYQLFDLEGAHYMLTLIEGGLSYLRRVAPRPRPGTVTHHHGEEDHEAYLERPFLEAREAIHRRMHQLGLAH